jgi:DNA polymerase-3 subunit delta'
MIDLLALFKNTSAYRVVTGDKKANRLSHAYLLLTADEDNLQGYLKIFAELLACNQEEPCGECRTCRLIDQKVHPDVITYPKKDKTVSSEEINELIEESFIRPIECDKKIFVIENAQTMNLSAQNKLLKTLEEPPRNVHIILGATNEFSLLPTIKSRVKKLEIPAFDKNTLIDALKQDCPDLERLETAVACGDGTVGKAKALYNDQDLIELNQMVVDLLVNMMSSKDVLKYSTLIADKKVDVSQFLSVLELILRDMLVLSQGKEDLVNNKSLIVDLKKAQRFNTGAIVYALESVVEAQKRKKFNMNTTMLIEWLLFQILEGKFKWQKF